MEERNSEIHSCKQARKEGRMGRKEEREQEREDTKRKVKKIKNKKEEINMPKNILDFWGQWA